MQEKLIGTITVCIAFLAQAILADEQNHAWQLELSPSNEMTLQIKAPTGTNETRGTLIVSRDGKQESRDFDLQDGIATVQLSKELPYRATDTLRSEAAFEYQVVVGDVIIGQGTMEYPRSTLKVTPESALQAIEDARMRQDLLAIEYLNRVLDRIVKNEIDALAVDVAEDFAEFWAPSFKGDQARLLAEAFTSVEIVAQAAPLLTLYQANIKEFDGRRFKEGRKQLETIEESFVGCLLEGAFEGIWTIAGNQPQPLDPRRIVACEVIGFKKNVYQRYPSETFYQPRLIFTTQEGRKFFCNCFLVYAKLNADGTPHFQLSAPPG